MNRCHQMKIRTDLADAGLYIMKYWLVQMLEKLEALEKYEIEL